MTQFVATTRMPTAQSFFVDYALHQSTPDLSVHLNGKQLLFKNDTSQIDILDPMVRMRSPGKRRIIRKQLFQKRVLARPDDYIGPVDTRQKTMRIYDAANQHYSLKRLNLFSA